MIDVSIVKEPVAEVEEPAALRVTLLLSDRQRDLVERFVEAHVPKRLRPAFRVAMLSRLASGRPGDAALRRSIALAGLDIGVERTKLEQLGWLNRTDSMDRHRGRHKHGGDDDEQA